MTQTSTDLTLALTGRILLAARRSGLQLRQPTLLSRLRALSNPTLNLSTASTEPVTEEQLKAIVAELTPDIIAGARQATAALADRKLSWTEAATLGTTLLGIVSKAVHEATALQNQNAEALVLVVYGVVFEQFVVPRLPLWLRPFAGVLKAGVVQGLQALYRTVIKRVRPAPTPTS